MVSPEVDDDIDIIIEDKDIRIDTIERVGQVDSMLTKLILLYALLI